MKTWISDGRFMQPNEGIWKNNAINWKSHGMVGELGIHSRS